ncbi:hypothetical protein FIA58_014870 [Flavobacterium jejuense]|uniref:Uncharacterized protein n=1 Tax=Flavobacterium jejuense TaxID=1544455 RepID=A0ABX0IYZ0_9FLAO|nr:hypothetical protein [Flavobacterium jejuense]NHN26964.1 hypothetical protein [Flavobacterium jejuense]
MKLSKQQIEHLYQFTRQHFVEYYDLQTELVDHLANAIEAKWNESPNLSFEDALQMEFKKFGVFGFMDVVEKRQKALSKRYNKIVWHHFKTFFSVPKILLTVSLVFGLFFFIKTFNPNEVIIILFGLILIIILLELFQKNKAIKKRKQKTGKVWLFEQIIFGYGSFSGILMLPFHILNSISNSSIQQNDYILFGISLLSISMILTTYIIVKIIPSKAEDYLKETYPEYSLVN